MLQFFAGGHFFMFRFQLNYPHKAIKMLRVHDFPSVSLISAEFLYRNELIAMPKFVRIIFPQFPSVQYRNKLIAKFFSAEFSGGEIGELQPPCS